MKASPISQPLFLGVDVGTSALKCGLFDCSGRCVGSARVAYPTRETADGAEQDAAHWWQALIEAVSVSTGDVDARDVAALAVGGHAPAPVFVDEALEPLAPVWLWSDQRSEVHRERLLAALGDVPVNGPQRLLLHIVARANRLRDTQPHLFARTRRILHGSDWLVARLTGRRVMTGCLSPHIIAAGKLPAGLLPDREVEAGQVVGGLSAAAADRLGLLADTPVVSGGLDSFLASVGSGLRAPGDACLSTGSSSIVALLGDCGQPARFSLDGQPLVSRPVRLAGRLLLWAQRCIGRGLPMAELLALATAQQALVLDQGSLDVLAQAVQAGGCADCQLFVRLSRRHSDADIFRLILEAILLGQSRALEGLEAEGATVGRLRSVGGLAAYPDAIQLQADVLGKIVEVPAVPDSGTLGAAMLAARALGLYDDHESAAAGMVGLGASYRPRTELSARYAALSREIHFA